MDTKIKIFKALKEMTLIERANFYVWQALMMFCFGTWLYLGGKYFVTELTLFLLALWSAILFFAAWGMSLTITARVAHVLHGFTEVLYVAGMLMLVCPLQGITDAHMVITVIKVLMAALVITVSIACTSLFTGVEKDTPRLA